MIYYISDASRLWPKKQNFVLKTFIKNNKYINQKFYNVIVFYINAILSFMLQKQIQDCIEILLNIPLEKK